MTPDEAALDRLIALGRQRGGLTTEDIRQTLPVEMMTAEELAAVIVRLEEADIPVEVDPALLSPRHRGPVPPGLKPAAEATQPSEPTKPAVHAPSLGPAASGMVAGATPEARARAASKRLPLSTAGLIILVAVALALFIVFGVWRFL